MGEQINIITKRLKIPASDARTIFTHNSADIRDYFVLHQVAFKNAPKHVRRLAHLLDKSTYVLVASLWEAYCEDIVTECLEYVIQYAPSYRALPQSIRDDISKGMRSGKDSPWDLAGDGWREYVKNRNKGFERKRNRDFAGPKSAAVEELFQNVLGIGDLRGRWRAVGPSICEELDAHLERRNEIVHRFTPGLIVNKQEVKVFCKTVARLIAYTDAIADEFLMQATGESRWTSTMTGDAEESTEAS